MLATSCEREQCLLGPQPDHCLAQGMVVEGSRAGRVIFSQSQTFWLFLLSYIGNRVTSNMVIVEVSLLSGFVQTPGSKMLVRTLESRKGSCGEWVLPACSSWELFISGRGVTNLARALCCWSWTKTSHFHTGSTRIGYRRSEIIQLLPLTLFSLEPETKYAAGCAKHQDLFPRNSKKRFLRDTLVQPEKIIFSD